ncbi:unnamed protein product, partial [Brenthis ino]
MKLIFTPLIRQYVLVVTANLAILTTGMSLAWPSPSMVKLRNAAETPLPSPITDEEGSWVVAGGFIIAVFTNFLSRIMTDKIGRKQCIIFASIVKLFGAITLVFANEVWIFILCRTAMLIFDCCLLVVIPVYASEIANKEQRGALGTFLQLFSSVGVLFTLSLGPFLQYKTFSIINASVFAVLTVPLLFLPDTPFYFYSKGRLDEAMTVLTSIRGSEILAKQELEEYKVSSDKSKRKIDKSALFKNKAFLRASCLGLMLTGGSQMIGSNAINFYLQTILESTKTSVPSEIASVIVGCIQVLASFCTTFIMNTFGRRNILMSSLVGILVGMLGLGTFFEIGGVEGYVVTGFMNYLPIISLILVIFCYNVGIGSVLWVVVSELFEGPSRALGVTISFTSSNTLIFVTTKYFALMTTALGPATTYWLFSSMCVLLFATIAIFLPETKGKSFSDIQIALGDNIDVQENINENKKYNIP